MRMVWVWNRKISCTEPLSGSPDQPTIKGCQCTNQSILSCFGKEVHDVLVRCHIQLHQSRLLCPGAIKLHLLDADQVKVNT